MSSFCKLLTFFNKNISIHAIFNDQSFNDTLTNIVSLNNRALVQDLNSTGGGILFMTIQSFNAQSLLLSHFHYIDMTTIMLNWI